MKTMKVITLNPQNETREFVYQCETHSVALAIVEGTLSACNNTGWTLKSFELVQGVDMIIIDAIIFILVGTVAGYVIRLAQEHIEDVREED